MKLIDQSHLNCNIQPKAFFNLRNDSDTVTQILRATYIDFQVAASRLRAAAPMGANAAEEHPSGLRRDLWWLSYLYCSDVFF